MLISKFSSFVRCQQNMVTVLVTDKMLTSENYQPVSGSVKLGAF